MKYDEEKKLVAILNKHGIGSGSYYGKIMLAMAEAYTLGIADTLSPEITSTGGDWQIAEPIKQSYIPYQLCPKCNGQGIVSKPPYIAGDVHHWSGSVSSFTCELCNGSKIIPMFIPAPC